MVASLDYSPRSTGIELRGGLGSRELRDSEFEGLWSSVFASHELEVCLAEPMGKLKVANEEMASQSGDTVLMHGGALWSNVGVRAR